MLSVSQVHEILNFLPTGIPTHPEPIAALALLGKLANTFSTTTESRLENRALQLKKCINMNDRSAAHDHRLKLGNLRVLGYITFLTEGAVVGLGAKHPGDFLAKWCILTL